MLVPLFYKNSVPACLYSTFVKYYSKMPIIAAVVAHRHSGHKQTLLTKSSMCTPVMTVNFCNFQSLNKNKIQPVQQSKSVPFSTSARSFKSKLSGVFNQSLSRLVKSDHEESRRFYAGKGGNKDRQSNKKTVVKVNEDELSQLIDVEAYKSQLQELSEQMKDDFTKQLSVRNNAGALEVINVEFDGGTYPLQELAQVGRKNPQLAVLNLSSLPDALQPVLKAINDSGMNLNPQQEGTTIYVPLPKVTREHRENLARNAKTIFTKYKTLYQTVQNRFIKICRQNKEGFSDDLVFSVQKQIMKIAADYIQEAETLTQAKSKELLQQE